MVVELYINSGGLKGYICILGQHLNMIFGPDIFIPKVAEFRLFYGPLAKIKNPFCTCGSV